MPKTHTSSPPPLSLTGLEAFRSAAALRSFSGAGLALGYSQSAVSRKITALEHALGTTLFVREPRGVTLTEAGTLLLEHATAALGELDAARAAIARLTDRVDGRLSVGVIPVMGMALIPRAVARFARSYPDVRIELSEGSTPVLVERVEAGTLDVAVVAERPMGHEQDFGTLRPESILVDPLRVAVPASHRLAARGRVPVEELAREPWIIGRAGTEGEPIFATWPSLTTPNIAYEAREWPARLGLVAAGLGIALMPGAGAPSVPAGIAVIDVDDPQHGRDPSAATVIAAGAPPAAAAMVDAIRTEAAQFAMARPPEARRPALG